MLTSKMFFLGSNTHNNNAPGGDGQTGSDGEGKAGMDRNIDKTIPPGYIYREY